MATNNFLPFSPTDTGTNLLSQSDYAVATDRTIGNQPGVASSKLVNKALRQATVIAANLAQLAANVTTSDVLDDGESDSILAQLSATIMRLPPTFTSYLSAGSSTHSVTMYFFIKSGSATVGATYTHNAFTYTVKATVAAGVYVTMTGTGLPLTQGTLTKASGTGDATLTFYAIRLPLYINARIVGSGGGAGSGGGTGGGTVGGAGGATSFGASSAPGGGGSNGSTTGGGSAGGTGGGAPTISGAAALCIVTGTRGAGGVTGTTGVTPVAGQGGCSFFGGPGQGADATETSSAPAANSGSGGGGGVISQNFAAGGGGSGTYVELAISTIAATFAVVIGAAGTAGIGVGGSNGSPGALGAAYVREEYQ